MAKKPSRKIDRRKVMVFNTALEIRQKYGYRNPTNLSRKERMEQLDRCKSVVKRITDGLGMQVDEPIREAIALLWALGYTTRQSCGGHVVALSDEKQVIVRESSPWFEIVFFDEIPHQSVDELADALYYKSLRSKRAFVMFMEKFYQRYPSFLKRYKLSPREYPQSLRMERVPSVLFDHHLNARFDADTYIRKQEKQRDRFLKCFTAYLRENYFSKKPLVYKDIS